MIVGLTGGIASGKSEAERILIDMGIPVIDADVVSRNLTAVGGQALPAIRDAFGDGVFCTSGELNRRALGAAVFADEGRRRMLEGIIHPIVTERISAWLSRQTARVMVLSAPLLYEANLDEMCDVVWVIACSRDTQIERCMARDGLTEAEAALRVDSQMPLAKKVDRGADIIWNTGTTEQLRCALVEKCEALWPLYDR